MIKKILSCLIALTFVFGLLAFSVSADTRLEIKAIDTTADVGQDVVVQICITSSDIRYFAFNVEWDATKLTYKSKNLLIGLDHDIVDDFGETIEDKDTTIAVDKADEGLISFQTMCEEYAGMLKAAAFDNTSILELTFTATDNLEDVTSIETPIDIVLWSAEDEAYIDKKCNLIDVADVADVDGIVTIVKPHETPVVDVNINGSGKIGEILTADADVLDNWGLEAELDYSWAIDSVEVSDEATYTPVAGDLGKEVLLTVTATVDAENNPVATGTAAIDVIKNDIYKPEIVLGEVPSTVRAGTNAILAYTYSDTNGIADASYARVYIADSIDGEYSFYNSVSADNAAIVIPIGKDITGKFIKLEVISKNADGDEGNAVMTDAIEVIKPPVSAESVTVFAKNKVYGLSGYKLIKVVANVDSRTEKIMVGNSQLYYSPDKNAFYGVVSAEDVGGQITPENIACAADILNSPSSIFYFGRPSTPSKLGSGKNRSTAIDLSTAKKIVLGTSTPTVDVYLASDVSGAEPDGNITALDISAFKKCILSGETLPVLR